MSGPALRLRDLLQHIVDAIGRINGYVANMDQAAFVELDPFVEWLLSDEDRLPAGFEPAI
jgi:hypothetical protein